MSRKLFIDNTLEVQIRQEMGGVSDDAELESKIRA